MPRKKDPLLILASQDVTQTLPSQEKFFATTSLKKSARVGTHLPDPTHEPYGYNPDSQFRHLFPALELPILKPPASCHPDDCTTFGHSELPPHELFLGDNLYVLRQLKSESVDLIYIDPPFFSNRTYTQIWGDDNEIRSFDDIFQDGMFSYLAWLNARLWEMKRVLKPTGSIYVHCDWHASHHIKCEMDKIFGYNNFINEIVWSYQGTGESKKAFKKKHDVILFYSKTQEYFFNTKKTTESISDFSKSKYDKEDKDGKYKEIRHPDGSIHRQYQKDEMRMRDVWEIPVLNVMSRERLGYPTQKPLELIQRFVDASCPINGVVADFFMGGGTTSVAVLGQRVYREKKLVKKRDGTEEEKEELLYRNDGEPRRFIVCDISRVAVSVTASRLIEIGEDISGITVTRKKNPTLGLSGKSIADIRLGYVGSYPIEKFKGIAQEEFSTFVRDLYQAHAFTGNAKWIHGLANGKLVISVGPSDPDSKVSLEQVKGVVEETLRQFATQFANGEEKILQVIGWGFEPNIENWKGQAIGALNKKGVKMQIELISLSSETFRQRIFRNIGESNLDLKFNRLNQLLSFNASPYPGKIVVTKQDGLKMSFRLEGAKPIGTGHLINCQWDFSYDGGRFASREHALNREGSAGTFEAVLYVEHEFSEPGEYSVAARIQDNLDGEAVVVAKLVLTERGHEISQNK